MADQLNKTVKTEPLKVSEGGRKLANATHNVYAQSIMMGAYMLYCGYSSAPLDMTIVAMIMGGPVALQSGFQLANHNERKLKNGNAK